MLCFVFIGRMLNEITLTNDKNPFPNKYPVMKSSYFF